MDHHNYPDALQQLPQSPASVQIPNTNDNYAAQDSYILMLTAT